jgi:hypothetical protein
MGNTGADWDMFSISSLWISSFTTMDHLSFPSFTVTNNIWWHESYECDTYHQILFAWSKRLMSLVHLYYELRPPFLVSWINLFYKSYSSSQRMAAKSLSKRQYLSTRLSDAISQEGIDFKATGVRWISHSIEISVTFGIWVTIQHFGANSVLGFRRAVLTWHFSAYGFQKFVATEHKL